MCNSCILVLLAVKSNAHTLEIVWSCFGCCTSAPHEFLFSGLLCFLFNPGFNLAQWKSIMKAYLREAFQRILSSWRSRCKTPRKLISFFDLLISCFSFSWVNQKGICLMQLIGSPPQSMSSICWIAPAHGGNKSLPYWLLQGKQGLQTPELAAGYYISQLCARAPSIDKRLYLF